jgi:hypothetical protein
MPDDPIIGEYAAGFTAAPEEKRKSFLVVGDNRELLFRPARLPDPETIPPRPWLYGTQILRGFVTILVAPGGVGKTGYAMGVALSLATGQPLFGEKIFERVNVAVLNLEDPMDELERRLAALMIHHKVSRADVEGRYFLYSSSSDNRRLTIAALSEDGYEIVHPDEQAIIREIQQHDIGVLFVDPCAESHELEENSNPQMIKAAAAWRRIARATGCGIVLLHHVRKGIASDIDAARGAKALTDSARVGLILSAMTEAEAEEFDIPVEDRTAYVRLDDAKSNMARRAGIARWFELETIELHNATMTYPAGDRVAAIRLWKPPSAMGDLTIFQCNEALDTIDRGPREGVRFTQSRSGKTTRWAGQVLIDQFGVSERRAASIIGTWVKNGVLEVRDYEDAEQRKSRSGVFANPVKRPGTGG